MEEYAYLNGKIMPIGEAKIGINDLSILRGYGIFDFFRAIEGRLIYLEDHLDRFENSLRLMHLKINVSREHLRENIRELVRLNSAPTLGVKLVATGGYSIDGYTPAETPNLMMTAKPFSIPSFENGTTLMPLEHRREMWEIKTTNYVTPINHLSELKEKGFEDVLYHFNGVVSESSRSNFFIVKDGILLCPNNYILRGVTRKQVMRLATQIMPVEERAVSLTEVLQADEAFITGSTKRVMPVLQIGDKSFEIGSYTRRLYELLMKNEKAND